MKSIKLSTIVFSLVLSTGYSWAQLDPNVIPPSPNVAALGKYGDIPVSPYTGVPNISIPIYEIVSRDISIPITISYHASGIKVDEEASKVGLGFALNAGGVIGRTVVGRDDFFESLSYHNKGAPDLPIGFSNSPTPNYIQIGGKLYFNETDINYPDNYLETSSDYDFEPDQYFYNFLGYSGKFILKPNKEAVLAKEEKIQINCLDEDGSAWEIITPDGFKYTFDQYETYLNAPLGTVKSAWYLTKIQSPLGEVVNLNYQSMGPQYIRPLGAYYESKNNVTVVNDTGCEVNNFPPISQMVAGKEYVNIYLESITFPHGKVEFGYDTIREDLEGDFILESIKIFKDGDPDPFKEFILGHGYFDNSIDADFNAGSPYIGKRLKLLSITETAIDEFGTVSTKPPYLFRYYEGGFNNLPAKTSFARDHWGYYNGKLSNLSLIPGYKTINSINPVDFYIGLMGNERTTNELYSKAFSLKEIEYPTGGITEFQYEPHDIDPDLSRSRDNSYFGNKLIFYEEASKQMSYNGQNKGTVYQDTLDLSDEFLNGEGNYFNTTVSAAFLVSTNCTDIVGSPNVYFELWDETRTIRHSRVDFELDPCSDEEELGCIYCNPFGSGPFTFKNEYLLPPGKYIWEAFISAGADGDLFEDIRATYNYLMKSSPLNNNVGGLRISQIIDHDCLDETNNKISTYQYQFQEDRDDDGTPEDYSSGILMAQPRYSYFEDNWEQQDLAPLPIVLNCLFSHLIRASNSNIPLNGSASGSTVGYSRVTVFYGVDGEFGKTVYEYENLPDSVLNYNAIGAGFFTWYVPRRPPSFPNLSHAGNGLLTRRTEYVKNVNFEIAKEIINDYSISDNLNNVFYAFEKRTSIVPVNQFNDIYLYPAIQSKLINLASTIERIYDQAQPASFLETQTNFFYDNPNHLQLTRQISIDSKGKTVENRFKYPLDYTSPGIAVDTLNSKHIVIPVIEQSQWVDGQLVSGQATRYAYDPINDLVQLDVVHLIETSTGITSLSESLDGENFDPAFKARANFNYDAFGNVIEQAKTDDIKTAYVWGYNHTRPVAQIIGSDYATVKTALGGDAAINALQTIDGDALISALAVLRTDGTLSTALITTYTYNPLVGITSQTDANGFTTRFIYDDFKRLFRVVDNDLNILKQYEYKYK